MNYNSNEAVNFANISATTAVFQLVGGKYTFMAVATWSGGSLTLEQQGPDGSTFLSVAAALTVNGGTVLDLAPGMYKLVVATASAIYATIVRHPRG